MKDKLIKSGSGCSKTEAKAVIGEDIYEILGRTICMRSDGTFASSLDELGVSDDYRKLVESPKKK